MSWGEYVKRLYVIQIIMRSLPLKLIRKCLIAISSAIPDSFTG